MKRLRIAGGVAAALVAAAIGVWAARTAIPDAPAGEVSREAPATVSADGVEEPFQLFTGDVARLSDWHGTPLVVNFWASWCPPCVAEMRDALEPMHQQLGDRVAFVGLNLQDDPSRASGVVEETGVTYTLGRDPSGVLFTEFGGFGMPTTVFINEHGTVVDSHTGAFTFEQLRALIERNFGV